MDISETDSRSSIETAATVVITTKDRVSDLRVALQSCVAQEPAVEIIVIDDASTDGTAYMVGKEFPSVRLIRHSVATGYIVGRNEAARLAHGRVIFSIDDDAEFTAPSTVRDTLDLFDDDLLGAVAIPYIDVNKSDEVRQHAPDGDQIWVTDRYIGTAHAVRKDVFLSLGGYRESYFHQGEERDFCQRMLSAGYYVRLGLGSPIHHYESPKRDTSRMDIFGRRNDILFLVWNAPIRYLIWQLPATIANGLLFGIRVRRPAIMLWGVIKGGWDAVRFFSCRDAVSAEAFRIFRLLQLRVAVRLNEIEDDRRG